MQQNCRKLPEHPDENGSRLSGRSWRYVMRPLNTRRIQHVQKDNEWKSKWRGVTISLRTGGQGHQPHPNHTPNPPPTHSHTNNTNWSIINTRFSRFQLERDLRTDGPTDGRTDKASYRVACPQLKMLYRISRSLMRRRDRKIYGTMGPWLEAAKTRNNSSFSHWHCFRLFEGGGKKQ